MGTSFIAVREPKQQLPDDFKTKALEDHPTAFGYASPQGGKSVHHQIFDGEEHDLADALKQIEDEYKDDQVFYWFVKANEAELNYESCQPIPLLEQTGAGEDGATLLAVVLEGEFPEFNELNEDGEAFTPEYFFVQNHLKPLVQELWELSGNKIDLLMSFLDKQVQKDKISAKFGPRATVMFIPCVGKALGITENKESGLFPWGFATRTLGFKTSSDPAVAAAAGKGKLSMKAAAAARAKGEHPAGGSVINLEEQFAPLLKANPQFCIHNSKLWVKPPTGEPWAATRSWWHRHTSLEKPDDERKVYEGFAFDDLRPNSPLRELRAKLMSEEVVVPKKADAVPDPAAAPPDVKQPDTKIDQGKMTLFIPGEQKGTYMQIKKAGKLPTTDLATLNKGMPEYPAASLQLGEKIDEMLMMTPEAYNRLPGHIKTCFLHELRLRLLGLYEKKADAAAPAAAAAPAKKLSMKDAAARKAG